MKRRIRKMISLPQWPQTLNRTPFRTILRTLPLAFLLFYPALQVPGQSSAEPTITLNSPNLDLRSLTDLISQKLSLNIIYDDKLASKRITIKTARPIPRSRLLSVLRNVLAVHNMSLKQDKQGFYRVVQTRNLAEVADLDDGSEENLGEPVIEVLSLKHLDVNSADKLLKPFLTPTIGSLISLAEQKRLLVIDFDHQVSRLKSILNRLDQPAPETQVQFVPVNHQEASRLAPQVQKLLQSKAKLENRSPQSKSQLELTHDERTNQIILVGSEQGIADALKFIKALDISLGLKTKVYSFSTINAGKVDNLTKELIGEIKAKRLYQSALDEDNNLLIATTTEAIHETISTIRKDMDVAIVEEKSPVRFYKLVNTKVSDILSTLQAVSGSVNQNFSAARIDEQTGGRRFDGVNHMNEQSQLTPKPSQTPEQNTTSRNTNSRNDPNPLSNALDTLKDTQARITADINTNTLIVVAPPRLQHLYGELIKRLDKRRPQVLCEIILVTLDTTDGFSLGVELSAPGDGTGKNRIIEFSNFGLSDVDPATGRLTLEPGMGLNGAIISADVGDVVVRALKNNARARVVAAPRILVNDNATGNLTSVQEAPFASVNSSDTVATTSFGGFASAGTTITISPNISEGDHLLLEYTIDLSSFTGNSTETLPPPRQTNQLGSSVTVPDGHTVIVGGLNRYNESETVNAVPILGQLPGWLSIPFKSTGTTDTTSTLFVFIRPIILRDDQFEDLKFISEKDRANADIETDFPSSAPVTITVDKPLDQQNEGVNH